MFRTFLVLGAVGLAVTAIEVQARPAPAVASGIEDVPICRGANGRLGRSPELLVLARAIAHDDMQLAQNKDIEDNLDIFEKLGLLEGHLIIGMALMDAKMPRDALPHFGHPVKELYDYLEPVLKARSVPAFKADLVDLEAKAKATPPDPKLAEAYAGVMRKVEALRATIPAAMANSQAFTVQAVALMMKASADDLGESIEKGAIANPVEYHDAMGFARYTAAYVQAKKGVLGASAPKIDPELKLVLSAFPSLKPPPKPVRTVAELEKASDRVKALAK